MTDAGKKALEELVAGLEGVTPGPWFMSGVRLKIDGGDWHSVNRYNEDKKLDEEVACIGYDPRTGKGMPDAKYIARCSPDRIRAIAAYVATLEARATAAEERVKQLEEAGEEYRQAKSEFARFEDENPNNSTHAWDELFEAKTSALDNLLSLLTGDKP